MLNPDVIDGIMLEEKKEVASSDSSRILEVHDIAKKVKVDDLYTDNNKRVFLSFFAALLSGLGDNEEALRYIEMSQELPHKESYNEFLKKLKKEIVAQHEDSTKSK